MRLRAVGVDGCRAGWIAALAWAQGSRVRTELRLAGRFASFVGEWETSTPRPTIAVDIPIGLPGAAGLRACDREAREKLRRRWMCVFPAPDRALFGLSFEEARDVVRARRGDDLTEKPPIMNRQTIALLPKIQEVDEVMRADLRRQQWIVEVHPEVSFLALAEELGQPLPETGLPRKRSAAGRRERLALLERVFPDAAERAAAAPWPRRDVGRDDILDAYAALWTACRYADDAESVECLGGDTDDYRVSRRIVA